MKKKRGPKDRSYLYKPGQSGNPGGRPKDTAAYYLTGLLPKDKWAQKVVDHIKKGNLHAMTLYAHYVFGKPAETLNVGQTQDALKLAEVRALARKQVAFIKSKAPDLLKDFLATVER